MRLLVVEDDADLGERLRVRLEHAGYAVDVADNGIDGAHLGATEPYDAAVLDLGLPGKPGLAVLREWRAAGSRLPVLILTARNGWAERVEGLQAGADDYLGKPFHIEELLARLQALLRRSASMPALELRSGPWRLDEARQCLCGDDGGEQALTATEFRLLRYFMRHPQELLSKTRLYEHVYGYDAEHDSNVIEVYVRRLRSLLGAACIETRRGQGYVFIP
ncbi:response regulator transcription factor [Thauera linaloolentis]|uniref:Winged helix family two component transcriptional regulator n=1 Tax=Thauera linaloolentis (strain DSM 12138 / JCM 21573 / CCUG 41526 / CIP 105981 / IAM 15112 / NBRC 102519 / 47Lol) TaxID=1123367 RepID=N6YY54_THAL4|nr:response regulator transcription factor [Thauera linaloolentis]ENO87083.1 winged helix family two component transcriptional regulator [Thauera linaloolentis 47Lol = DSM 12138]MCM8565518.1 response regulator transcription factor [Thauera linaloolentis]